MSRISTALVRSRRAAIRPSAASNCTIEMSIDTDSVTTLRQLAMRVCGDALGLIRIAASAHGAKMRVWLRVRTSAAAGLIAAVLRDLPGAAITFFPATSK